LIDIEGGILVPEVDSNGLAASEKEDSESTGVCGYCAAIDSQAEVSCAPREVGALLHSPELSFLRSTGRKMPLGLPSSPHMTLGEPATVNREIISTIANLLASESAGNGCEDPKLVVAGGSTSLHCTLTLRSVNDGEADIPVDDKLGLKLFSTL
jgi:hypothetical protein